MKTKEIVKARFKKFQALEDKAVSWFCESMNFDAYECLNEKDQKEYTKLFKEVHGYCHIHQDESCDC